MGASGFVVNEVALALIVSAFGVNYLLGAVAATQVSTLWNFSLVEFWAFRDLDAKRSRAHRLLLFFLVNNIALLFRGPILVALTTGFGLNYLVSNFVSLGVLTLVRFAVADNLIWASVRTHADEGPGSVMDVTESDSTWLAIAGEVAVAGIPTAETLEQNESHAGFAVDGTASDSDWIGIAGEVALAGVPGGEASDRSESHAGSAVGETESDSEWLGVRPPVRRFGHMVTHDRHAAPSMPAPTGPAFATFSSGSAGLAVVEAPAERESDAPAVESQPRVASWVLPLAIALVATAVRVWNLDRVGFNSDEVVYSSQAALLAGKSQYSELFTLFRAHPLLFQGLLSLVYRVSMSDYLARLLSVAFGLGTVAAGYWAAKSLYGRRVALIAAAILAVMPYEVLLSRQVLLDGPMVFFATVALGLAARFAATREPRWLYAATVALGLTFLTKETGILLAGAMYAFVVLTPQLRVRIRHLACSIAILAGFVFVFPLAVALGKRSNTGEQFFLWQVLRRPNHGMGFYFDHVPEALGFAVVLLAILGLCFLRRDRTWRETLLLCWIVIPVLFFVLWPVKGFQYLLPIAPAVAILASRSLAALPTKGWFTFIVWRVPVLVLTGIVGAAVAITLLVPTWAVIRPSDATTVNAGAGGMPRGREAASWLGIDAPIGATVITIGPSMSNLVRYYGARASFGLSVSTNPLHRNPVYEPVGNADLRLRRGEIQYLVWDATSAARTPRFGTELTSLARRYHGRIVHRERVSGRDVVVVFKVRP